MAAQRRPKLILLETDVQTADRFRRGAGRFYDVRVEACADDALAALRADPLVAAFAAGASRNGESPVAVLARVKEAKPGVLRIMLAAPTDLATVIQGLHSGVVERSLNLPVADAEILSAVTRPGVLAPSPAAGSPAAPAARPAPRRAG